MIKVNNIGCQFINYGGIHLSRPEGTSDYLLLFFRTDAELLIDGVYVPIKRNTFYIYPKGVPQYYKKTDGDFINDWIHFDIDDELYFQRLHIPLATPIQLYSYSAINRMMYDLFIEFFDVGTFHNDILDQKANTLFHKFSDLYHMEKKSSLSMNQHRQSLINLRNRIYNYEYIPDKINDIADDMNMSLSYLEHLYKKIFQVTITHDLIHARINHACMLLNGTDYSISHVSALCNYDNLEHFSRQFRKIKGCSPTKYRRLYRDGKTLSLSQ